VRVSGNRIVWIDEGSRESSLYMMAFSQPRKDAPETGDPGSPYVEYKIRDLVFDDKVFAEFQRTPFDQIYFVFYPGKSGEVRYSMRDFVWSDAVYEKVLDMMAKVDDMVFRLYK
jgi:hypothetical protein